MAPSYLCVPVSWDSAEAVKWNHHYVIIYTCGDKSLASGKESIVLESGWHL